jgi:protein SCO1/2
MRRLAFILAASVLLSACGGNSTEVHTTLLNVGDFTLTDENGEEFRLSSLRGKPTLLFFGYTHCPDACPTMMSKVSRAYRIAGEDAKQITTLFVSVDVDRDSPQVLKEYMSYFGAVPSKGLTGTKEQIDEVVKKFAAYYEIHDDGSAMGPTVDHTVRLYMLDDKGDVVVLFAPSTRPEDIAKEMRRRL